MAAPIKELAKALASELSARTGKAFERRYAPYYSASQLAAPKYVIITTRERSSVAARDVEDLELSVWVGLQQALPDIDDAANDYIEQTDWLDARMDEMELIKDLWRPGGPLRNVDLAGCEFRSQSHDPVYLPDLLLDNAIFASFIELTFILEKD